MKSGTKSYGPKRDIAIRAGDTKFNVTLWRDATSKTLNHGDDIALLDGRVSQFGGKPSLKIQIGAQSKITMYVLFNYGQLD